ncbi:hypothetical protein IWW54_006814, partial [Coemansia sp. RSA 2705]
MTQSSGDRQPTHISTAHGSLSLPADVAELLTPFLSPTSTPLAAGSTNRTFSPLTSPALAPNASGTP